jgi:hypothetical protein
MEPDGVIEAGVLHIGVAEGFAMGHGGSAEKAIIGDIGQCGAVDLRIIRQGARGAHPDALFGGAGAAIQRRAWLAGAEIDGARGAEPFEIGFGQLVGHAIGNRFFGLDLVGAGDVGHLILMAEARFAGLERGCEVEDHGTVLDCDNAAGGEAAAVTVAFDAVENGCGGIAGADEIAVQRMDGAIIGDGFDRRHQRLPDHLPAEAATFALRCCRALEEIPLDGFDRQDADKPRGQFFFTHHLPFRH